MDTNNRWVVLASKIPWEKIEEIYSKNFKSKRGPNALSSRVAFGSLIIQTKLGISDEETVNQISENPYLQYFIGYEEYRNKAPFDSSMMTHFRKRLGISDIKEIDKLIYKFNTGSEEDNSYKNDHDESDDDIPKNKGKLIIDSTCAPADISYPTDLKLLNQAREKSEKIIDILCKNRVSGSFKAKPVTYRKTARSVYLSIAKQKKPSKKALRKAIRYQLNSIKRNLRSIDKLIPHSELQLLDNKLYKDLLVISTLYEQQLELYTEKKHSVSDRIVSITQPHVRPVVRGKAGSKTEFGAKLSISLVNGWSFLDKLSWDSYNEGVDLISQVEIYKKRFGAYPESIHADQIYRNRENRKFCKENNIRLSGPKLGRPCNSRKVLTEQRKQEYADSGIRNAVEGRFGVGKRRYSLDKIMAKLSNTSESAIAMIFLVMNLDVIIHFLALFLCRYQYYDIKQYGWKGINKYFDKWCYS